jgi:hypothetical protein
LSSRCTWWRHVGVWVCGCECAPAPVIVTSPAIVTSPVVACRSFDIDSSMHSRSSEVSLESQDFVGEVTCQLAQIMGARGATFTGKIVNSLLPSRSRGTVTLRGEEVQNANARVAFQVAAEHLENKVRVGACLVSRGGARVSFVGATGDGVPSALRSDTPLADPRACACVCEQDTFGKSDPFIRFSRVREDGGSIAVFKTEVVRDNLNPTWHPIVTTMQRLCNGDPYRPVLAEVFDWDKDGSHDIIGSATTSLDDVMRRAASGERIPLINATRRAQKGSSYTNSGLLRVVSATVTPQPSFLDFIVGGCELNFMVCLVFPLLSPLLRFLVRLL